MVKFDNDTLLFYLGDYRIPPYRRIACRMLLHLAPDVLRGENWEADIQNVMKQLKQAKEESRQCIATI
jgi:hypothetical protein